MGGAGRVFGHVLWRGDTSNHGPGPGGLDLDMRIADLKPGWDVVTNDDHRFGTILEVGQHYVKVDGGFFSGDLYVPASAIANVESEKVHLNLAHDEIDRMAWHQPPRSPDDLQTTREPDNERDI